MQPEKIGFIGAGQMARALASGFVKAGLFDSGQIVASDAVETALADFAQLVPGAQTVADNAQVFAGADVVFLAVKPQHINGVLAEIAPQVTGEPLIVSIAAGVPISRLAAALGKQARLVRVMPNTPCLIGRSASAYCLGPNTTEADAALVEKLLSAVGRSFCLDEKLLDAVTGLSGSGPAFVCVMIEALSDGGVRMGLPRDVARALAAQTVRGTAELILKTGEHPAVLKDRVASPGGTTIAGLEALEAHGFRAALIAAVEAATERSAELGREG
jgi:pyrroline-5-carboxylate reductase